MLMELSTFLYRLQTGQHLKQLCLLLVLFQIMLMLPVQADSLQGDTWETSTTKTTWFYGARSKSTFYCVPQVVDVGAGFVEYNIERVSSNEYWADCPTSSFRVKTANTEVWAVNRSKPVLSKCIWQVWAFNGSVWLEIEDSDSHFKLKKEETQASLEYWRVMEDNSTFNVTWTFANLAKASVTFTAGQARPYAITWHVESPRATRETQQNETLNLYEEDDWLCLLNYYDARLLHNQTQLSEIGKTGRKAMITFCNRTMTAGEEVFIDPEVSTFYSEASRDGWIRGGSVCDTSTTWLKAGRQAQPYRSYVSFNTSSISENETLESAFLELLATSKAGSNPVDLEVYNGYYGTTLEADDYDTCTTYEGVLLNTGNLPLPKWYSLSVSTDNLNITGLSQYRIKSSQETTGTFVVMQSGDSDYEPVLTVHYAQEEEDGKTKGEGTESIGAGSFSEQIQQVTKTIGLELAKRGLYWIVGLLVAVVIAGVYASTKTKKVSRTARGTTGGGGSRSPRGRAGSKRAQPRGTPKKRSRDARGRFK